MSTNAIISATNLDINKVTFGDLRVNKQTGAKSVPVKYNGQQLQVRLEKTLYYGVSEKENKKDNGTIEKSYTLKYSFKGCDPKAHDRASRETGAVGAFYNFLLDLQSKLLDTAEANSSKWFGKARSRTGLEETIKALVGPSVELVNGEWVATGKYAPSLKMKVPVYDGRVSMDVTDAAGRPVLVTPDNITQVFPKPIEASVVVSPSIYISGQGWGVTWRISYARVTPSVRASAADVFRDEIEQEVASGLVSSTEVPSEETREEEEHQPEEVSVPYVEETPTAPPPAPSGSAPKTGRRRVAAAV